MLQVVHIKDEELKAEKKVPMWKDKVLLASERRIFLETNARRFMEKQNKK